MLNTHCNIDIPIDAYNDDPLNYAPEVEQKSQSSTGNPSPNPLSSVPLANGKAPLRAVNVGDFLRLDIPHRTMVVDPIIPTQGLAMLYAERGCGKTFAALAVGLASASGTSCFGGRWSSATPQRVVYVDGEMPAQSMQSRVAQLASGLNGEPPSEEYFRIVTPDLQPDYMPNLATPEGQRCLEPLLVDCDLLILDNLSTLCHGGEENKAESWVSIQEWLLRLRKAGLSVLMVHHSGKGGQQRGTSKREDILDTSIQMKRPSNYDPEKGAVAEVHLRKARGVTGEGAKSFLATLTHQHGHALVWQIESLDDYVTAQVREMLVLKMTQREIASELGVSQSTVSRIKNGLDS